LMSKDLKEFVIADKVETGKELSFLFEIALKVLLDLVHDSVPL
jgi:hypothetical protein